MKIKGIDGFSTDRLNFELQRGGRFVVYQYCFSVVVMSMKRGSDIYFIPAEQNTFVKGIKYSVFSLLAGWWGIPWGPIYTVWAVVANCSGGKNVTQEVLAAINSSAQ